LKRCLAALAVAALSACGGSSDRRLARTLDEATLALRRGELVDAQNLADRGLAQSGRDAESAWAWTFRLVRGEVLILRREIAEAGAILQRAVPAGAPFDVLRARQAYLRARWAVARGRLDDAMRAVDEAAPLASPFRDERIDVEWLGGQLLMRLGRTADADSRLTRAMTAAADAGDHYRQARALNDLGMGRLVRNRFDEAAPWFERALAMHDLESFTVYGQASNNAGICYSRLGQFDRAIAVQRRAVAIHEHQGPRIDYEHALGELGGTYLLQGDIALGLPFIHQALVVSQQAGLTDDAALWARNLASGYTDMGRWDEAERFNAESRRLNPPDRASKLVFNTLTAAQIAAGRGRADEARTTFERVLAEAGQELSVRWDANAGLARLDLAAKRLDAAAAHFGAALHVIERTRSDLLATDYKVSFLSRLIRFYQAYVDALVDQGKTDRALEVADASRARVLAEREGASVAPTASAAALRRLADRSGLVMLAYWVAPAKSYLWVVAPSGIHLVALPPAETIEPLVREHQNRIANATADPLADDRLYRTVVEPAAAWIPPGASVVIVPDGPLHAVNFETLAVAAPRPHFWIEDVELRVAPSLALLGAGAGQTLPRRRSLLLVGDASSADAEFPPLKYASAEMGAITRHFEAGAVVALDKDAASPASYRASHPEAFAMIHFTAHASANAVSPLDSAVILAGPPNAYKLYARDIADDRLGADLVTVSACRSAGERAYSGEGLVGFAWAFLRAGARAVIAGLWDVDDRSTAELMDDLYARLAGGAPPARALRGAKLALMRRQSAAAKPYYWGPFQLFSVSP
jgi:CHAT domain-containing protein/tetratricopeptide (TPR) repeat protein